MWAKSQILWFVVGWLRFLEVFGNKRIKKHMIQCSVCIVTKQHKYISVCVFFFTIFVKPYAHKHAHTNMILRDCINVHQSKCKFMLIGNILYINICMNAYLKDVLHNSVYEKKCLYTAICEKQSICIVISMY